MTGYPIPARLSLMQADGLCCVTCAREADVMRPVGHVDGSQVFACQPCHDEWQTLADARPVCHWCGRRVRPLIVIGTADAVPLFACVPVCPPR